MALLVQITYDGTPMTDPDGIYLHTIVRGGPGTTPSVKGIDDAIPGADGFFLRNRRKERRIIEARGWIAGVGAGDAVAASDYWDNRVALESLLDPTSTGTLEVTLPNGDSYSITARPLPMDGMSDISTISAEIAVQWETVADVDWEPSSS